MRSLIPRDSFFQDLFDFRRDFDQIFHRFLSWPSAQEEPVMNVGFTPAVESFVDKDGRKFYCQVLLPGVAPKDANLQVQGNTLTISGERSATRETKKADYLRREVAYGSFQRTILLPEGVDTGKLNAEYRNGILEITAPIAAAALPRKVEIKALPGPAAKHASSQQEAPASGEITPSPRHSRKRGWYNPTPRTVLVYPTKDWAPRRLAARCSNPREMARLTAVRQRRYSDASSIGLNPAPPSHPR